jgi:hypothetical protein
LRKYRDEADFREEKLADDAIVFTLLKYPMTMVYNVTPFLLNKRVTIQQGTFLLPGNIQEPFETNLAESVKKGHNQACKRVVIDVCIQQRNDILQELANSNIRQAVLFPDLDGLAKSLWTQLAFPEKFGIPEEKKDC